MPQADNVPDFDAFLHAKVLLPKSGEVKQAATVLGQSTDLRGEQIGQYDENPIAVLQVWLFDDNITIYYWLEDS